MHVPIFVDGRLLFVLSCVADRLLVHANDPDTLVVVDLKTGKPKIELDQSCVALAILKMTMPGYARFVLHYDWIDEGGRVDRDTVTTADVKGIWPRILSRAVEVLTAEEHLSEPNPGCVYCCLRPSCQPEVGVALDDATDLFEE